MILDNGTAKLISKRPNEKGISDDRIFLNGKNTTTDTINQLNDRSSNDDLSNFALDKLFSDNKKYEGNFPSNYYEEFGEALFKEAITLGMPTK